MVHYRHTVADRPKKSSADSSQAPDANAEPVSSQNTAEPMETVGNDPLSGADWCS